MSYNPFQINNNQLYVGYHAVSSLAHQFGTPLYIMDEALMRKQMRLFKQSFKHTLVNTEVAYASKAFLNLAMCRLVDEEGLSLDVVSGGELYTAKQAKFPMNKIIFHGNHKTRDELQLALDDKVGLIVLDNPFEMETILALKPTQPVSVLLRVNPGIEAHTHDYIATSRLDSKFGMSIFSDETLDLIKQLNQNEQFDFKGLHCHIGSQIFDKTSFIKEIQALLHYVKRIFDEKGIIVEVLNLGGGFGVQYTVADQALDLEATLPQLLDTVYTEVLNLNLQLPKIIIEPGRSIVANAGITAYTIGATKKTLSGKEYVFVDGSMADHIRTALYQAKYEAALVDRMDETADYHYTLAGRACESGDILIHDCVLPKVEINDILCVFSTGAYHYSMSSHYNRLLKPAVIFVNEEAIRLVNKRETYEDLLTQDRL
jgi:diaminopimelate decarboxylase